MRVALFALVSLAPCFFAGCASIASFLLGGASVEKKVADCLAESRFADARKLLDEEGVGASPRPSASQEGLAARTAFTERIQQATERDIGGLLSRGQARAAQQLAAERAQLCPWSVKLVATTKECEEKIATIVAAEEVWAAKVGVADPTVECMRQFLIEWTEKPSWCFDSDALRALRTMTVDKMRLAMVACIDASRGRLDLAAHTALRRDLQLAGVTQAEQQQLGIVLDILDNLPLSATANREHLSKQSMDALGRAMEQKLGRLPGRSGDPIGTCVGKCWGEVEDWIVTEFGRILQLPDVTYEDLVAGERWAGDASIRPRLDSKLATAHVIVASRLASHPLAATVALVHLARARSLGISESATIAQQVEATAQATRSATPRPAVSLRVTCDKNIDPQVELIVSAAIRIAFASGDEALSEITPFAQPTEQLTVTVHITSADLVSDFSDVRAVTSSYLSHFQEVPNPQKRLLRLDCDFAESRVSSAKWAYQSAVSSHNVYQTQWSLNSVNNAYNDYVRSVDDYNFKVGIYNATPSLVSEPVFMPYAFRQGTVRFGWQVSVEATCPGLPLVRQTRESVAKDFVRIGARASDKSEAQRRDDPLDIDTSADAGLNHLYEIVRAIRDSLNPSLGKLRFATTASLSSEQQAILSWVHHPLGIQLGLADDIGVPKWASECTDIKNLVGDRRKSAPPELHLAKCVATAQGPLTTEAASTLLAPFVCQTTASDGVAVSTGTGTLIGRNGLVLTCAHVLSGPSLQVLFPVGTWRGHYVADVVFVNVQRDVAILRARGLANEQWANLRSESQAAAGEPILAIGNPGMDVGGTNLGGVATGIVSNPMLERRGTQFVSADIAIASGSSGGPLFSLKDGAMIGVVQMVATMPGLGKEHEGVSSTGYLCLAAPASLMSEWIGITYEVAK